MNKKNKCNFPMKGRAVNNNSIKVNKLDDKKIMIMTEDKPASHIDQLAMGMLKLFKNDIKGDK